MQAARQKKLDSAFVRAASVSERMQLHRSLTLAAPIMALTLRNKMVHTSSAWCNTAREETASMLSTKAWAKSHGIEVGPNPPAVEGYSKRCPRPARQIAIRSLILQGVVAVAAGVEATPVVEWFHRQRIWRNVTPEE